MIDNAYFKQAELLLRVLPFVDKEAVFALKGGTAINFFMRDLPRISIDIDLAYLPVGERDSSLHEITETLVRISKNIEDKIPGTKVIAKKIRGTEFITTLFLRRQEASIKIEPNVVIRGSVFPVERRVISPKARELFGISMECRTLSENELYAGKICAALDRQHPRDLFDVYMLFKSGKFNDDMRRAFIVYLISHDRPMVEVLNPGLSDIKSVYETEFKDMTLEEVTGEDLEKTRQELIIMITSGLTIQEKQFIVSVKEGMPQWGLIGIEGVENLPAVKWKLINIGKMNQSKHSKAVRKLRDYLQV
jgi:predicted nucleotidyltransferase component of viral defense system